MPTSFQKKKKKQEFGSKSFFFFVETLKSKEERNPYTFVLFGAPPGQTLGLLSQLPNASRIMMNKSLYNQRYSMSFCISFNLHLFAQPEEESHTVSR